MSDRDRESAPPTAWTEVGRYSGLGMTWALATLLFLAGGWWVDGKLGTKPLFTILGAFVGGVAGFYRLYRELMRGPGSGAGDDG